MPAGSQRPQRPATASAPVPAAATLQEWYELWDTDEGVLVGLFDEEDPALAVVRDAIARFGARSKRVARYGLLRWAGRRKGSRRGARATLLVEAPELAKRALAAVQETPPGSRGRRPGSGNR